MNPFSGAVLSRVALLETIPRSGPVRTFAAEAVLSNEPLQVTDIHAVDLDADGDVDLLSTSRYGEDCVAWHENLGNATFAPQQAITFDVNSPQRALAADLDGDGWPDVVASVPVNAVSLTWHRNQFGTMSRY